MSKAFDEGVKQGEAGNWGSNPYKILTQEWRDFRDGLSAGWKRCPERAERAANDRAVSCMNDSIGMSC